MSKKQASQFARIESHSLVATKGRPKNPPENWKAKSTVSGICGEAARLESHSKHLEQPPDFDVVFGMSPLDLSTRLTNRFAEIKKEGGRLKADQCVMCEGVFSYPEPTCDENFFMWLDDSIDYLKEKYGEKLQSVVVHYDESHPHLHFFLADMKTLSVNEIDPARMARRREEEKKFAMGKGEDGKFLYSPKMTAQKDALKEWLNEYHFNVSEKYEHAREIGARKARLHGTPRQVRMGLELEERKKALDEKEARLIGYRDKLKEQGEKLHEHKEQLEQQVRLNQQLFADLSAELEKQRQLGNFKGAAELGSRILALRKQAGHEQSSPNDKLKIH